MLKSIVAALDGSEESLAGLTLAVDWAERLGADLRGVYVEDERRFTYFPSYSESEGSVPKPLPLPEEQRRAVEEETKVEIEELQVRFQSITAPLSRPANFRVLRGGINELLVQETMSADMMVIGKRGREDSPNSQAAGPTTETVLHEAQRPVLVVPRGEVTGGPVLVAYDGSRGVQRVVMPGLQLASALAAPVTVLTVNADHIAGERIQLPLHDYTASYGLECDFRIEREDRNAAKNILETADRIKAGMIVMGAFTRSPLKEFFFGSVTRSVLTRAPCPVLMMT